MVHLSLSLSVRSSPVVCYLFIYILLFFYKELLSYKTFFFFVLLLKIFGGAHL